MVENLHTTALRAPLWRVALLALLPLGLVLAIGIPAAVTQARAAHQDLLRLFEESRETSLALGLGHDLQGFQRWLDVAPPATAIPEPVADDLRHHLRAAQAALQQFVADDDPSTPEHQATEARLLQQLGDACRELETRLSSATPPEPLRPPLQQATHAAALLAGRLDQESKQLGQAVDRSTSRLRQLLVLLGGAALTTFAWFLFLLRRRVLRPVQQLQRATVDLVRGAPLQLPTGPDDELGRLGAMFAAMAARLRAHHDDLEQRVAARSREVLRSAQLAELGTLAAGIAHEINNPLASIAACAEGLQRELARDGRIEPDGLGEYLAIVHREAMRARDITQRLLDLARHEPGRRERIDLGHELRALAPLFTHQFANQGVQLRLEAPPQGPWVEGEASALRQVVMNLLRNALQASPPSSTVVARAHCDQSRAWLEIADQGPGIPAADLERIFEPFFTRKPPGQGTGLGLAIAHRIVESHGGRLLAVNLPSGGARFTVELPLAAAAGAAEADLREPGSQ